MRQLNYLRVSMLAFFLVFVQAISCWGQTNPALYDLSVADFSFTGFSSGVDTNYPASMLGWKASANLIPATLSSDNSGDLPLNAYHTSVTTGSIRNDTVKGISLLASGSTKVAGIGIGLNASGRTGLTATWTCRQINSGSRTNGVRLQYRTSTSGNFTDVPGTEFLSGDTAVVPDQSFTNIQLPASLDNAPVIYLRFVYYDVAGSGSRDRIAIDDISISSGSLTPATVALSSNGVSASSVNQGALGVLLQRYALSVSNSTATLSGLTITTAGTYNAADLTNLQLWYSADTLLDASDVMLSSITPATAGSQNFVPFTSQLLDTGITAFLLVTSDVASNALSGHTFSIAATSFSDFIFSSTVVKTGTDPMPPSGTKTIVSATPDVVLYSATPAVDPDTLEQGQTDGVLYALSLRVTTANATLTSVSFSTTGTYSAGDLSNLKLWYSQDDVFSSAADSLLSIETSNLGQGIHTYSGLNQILPAGDTAYLFLTADIPCTAVAGNTVFVNAVTTTDLNFISANKTGTAYNGGTQTLGSVIPSNADTFSSVASDSTLQLHWTLPSGCLDEMMIVAATSTITAIPTGDGNSYTADATFGSGSAFGNGWVIYKGSGTTETIYGLSPGNTYFFRIFSRNDQNWSSGLEISDSLLKVILPGEVLINQMSPDYAGASDEYVELVNTTSYPINLSALKLNYRSAAGNGNYSQVLSGTIPPFGFWLLSSNAVVTVGRTSLQADDQINSAFNSTAGQLALLRISDNVKIDGIGYGALTGGSYYEDSAAVSPPTDGGLKRIFDGVDSDRNWADFQTVANADIYLHNHESRVGIAGSVIPGGDYRDLSVTGSTSLAGAVRVSGRLDVFNSAVLTTNDFLTLRSTAADSSAVVGNVDGSINGSVMVERYLSAPTGGTSTGRAWRLLTVPLRGNTNNSIFANWQNSGVINGKGVEIWGPSGTGLASGPGYSMYSYNASANAYQPVTNTQTTPLFTVTGNESFLLFCSGPYGAGNISSGSSPATLMAKGNLNTGTQNFSFTPNGSNDMMLIGNPFASPVSFDEIWNNSGTTNISRKFWVLDPTKNDIGGYVLVQWNNATTSYDVIPSASQSEIIQNGQAFFVEAANSSTAMVAIEESDKKSFSSQLPVFRQNGGSLEKILFELRAVRQTGPAVVLDGALVNCHQSFSNTVSSSEDGMKMPNFNENVFLPVSGTQLAINNRDLYDVGDTLRIGLSNMRSGNYELVFSPSGFSGANLSAVIYDTYLNTSQPLTLSATQSYSFTVTGVAGSGNAQRLFLVFGNSLPLSLQFLQFQAVPGPNKTVLLNWKMSVGEKPVRFEVERSSDGQHFESIASIDPEPDDNYKWTDERPAALNFYRIRAQFVRNGSVYSRILQVDFTQPADKVVIYPNPIESGELCFDVEDIPAGFYNLQIRNINGQMIEQTQLFFNKKNHHQRLRLPSLAPGTYHLLVRDQYGNIVTVESFVSK